jgi:hypothetical protein
MEILLGKPLKSSQSAMGESAKEKKTPQTKGTNINDPSRSTKAPKTKTIRNKAVRFRRSILY